MIGGRKTKQRDMDRPSSLVTSLLFDSLRKVAHEISYLEYSQCYFLNFETHFFAGATISTLSPISC
jgi:hypothetical protein